jgi:hypothetical protein
MHVDTDTLNKMYFGFLEEEYGFAYAGGPYGNGIYSSSDIDISFRAWGSMASILSVLDVDIQFKQEPACTHTYPYWIAEYWGVPLHLRETPSYSSLLKYYKKQSVFFKKYGMEILYHHEKWLVPVLKLQFQWILDGIYRDDLQALLTNDSLLCRYLKDKDPNWEPLRGSDRYKNRNWF